MDDTAKTIVYFTCSRYAADQIEVTDREGQEVMTIALSEILRS